MLPLLGSTWARRPTEPSPVCDRARDGYAFLVDPDRTETLERELKFHAPVDSALPDLRDLVGRTERLPEQHLRTSYFDTPYQRLWKRGLTLRHRQSEDEEGGTWTLKLPSSTSVGALTRMEVSWPGPADQAPPAVLDVLRGTIRRSQLLPLVELTTIRQRLVIHDERDERVAEIDDDRVFVVGGPRDGFQFRQVEMEVLSDDDGSIDEIRSRLDDAGFRVERIPKLAKALGIPEPISEPPRVSRKAPLAEVVQRALRAGFARLIDHDWRLRLSLSNPTPDDVHQARVATRRLRSDIKTFRSVLDPVWVRHMRQDLKWLGTELGAVRDADVLGGLLDDVPTPLLRRLESQRQAAARDLDDVLLQDRYLTLLDRLDAAAQRPPFLAGEDTSPQMAAVTVLPGLIGDPGRALRRQVRKAGREPTDRQLHRIRIKAKQVRYAAETASPVLGKPATRIAKTAEQLQTLLGAHHDAVTAEAWLGSQSGIGSRPPPSTLPAPTAFEAGRLAAEQRQRQSELRRRWPEQWKKVRKSMRKTLGV
jgi:CHAD domain-containing protein